MLRSESPSSSTSAVRSFPTLVSGFTQKPTSLSWPSSSFPNLSVSFDAIKPPSLSTQYRTKMTTKDNLFMVKILKYANKEKESRLSSLRVVFVLQKSFIQAAWTRRSQGEAAKRPNRKSWKQRTDMYMRPFVLDVFFSRRFIHAKVMHRGTFKVVSAASTNSKDLRYALPSPTDDNACRIIGNLIAERCKEADVFVISYEPSKNGRIEGKIGIVIDTIKDNGIIFV